MSFLRKQESINFWHYWTPVCAGVINWELLEVLLSLTNSKRQNDKEGNATATNVTRIKLLLKQFRILCQVPPFLGNGQPIDRWSRHPKIFTPTRTLCHPRHKSAGFSTRRRGGMADIFIVVGWRIRYDRFTPSLHLDTFRGSPGYVRRRDSKHTGFPSLTHREGCSGDCRLCGGRSGDGWSFIKFSAALGTDQTMDLEGTLSIITPWRIGFP